MDYVWRSKHYQNVMSSYLGRAGLKRELFSEIYINWSVKPEVIEELFNRNEREFGGYFNMTCRNNVMSKSSPFYKNVIKTNADVYDMFSVIEIEDEDGVEQKITKEIQISKLTQGMLDAKLSWFERQLFLEYYSNNKLTYQMIADKYELSKSYLYKLLNGVKLKIKSEIK